MLSTVNQHKSSIKTESVRSITLVSKAASRFSFRKIPEFVYSVLPISIALSMGMTLVGCGVGNNPTSRTDQTPPPTSTVRTSYNLTIQSPVLLNNVKVTVTDTTTGTIITQSIIQNGNEAVLAIPLAHLKTNIILMATLSPVDSSSKYFDPMLNNELGALADFNQSLHGLFSMNNSDMTARIDPFSEIIYQRTLIRSGTLNISAPKINSLKVDQLALASNEMNIALGTVAISPLSVLFNTTTNIAAINLFNNIAGSTSVNAQANTTLIALGQLALYAQNNPTAQRPYLEFATRASLDLQDGDLDGMTIMGGDTAGTVRITNPILYSGIISDPNNDPDHIDLTSFITINKDQRRQRGIALKQATISYFNKINAVIPLASRTDNASLNFIQFFDYGTFVQTASGAPIIGEPSNQIGAGNYTRAFGLPTGTDLKQALDTSDATDRSNDILQLNGTYQGSNGCQLSIGYDGTIQLSQGTQTFQAVVSRKFSDRLIRISGNQYLLNVASIDLTAPRFIQIRTIGSQVISADAGRSTNQAPITLDTTELSCTF